MKSSFQELSQENARGLKKKLEIRYQGEQGVDQGGLKREWITILSRELFDPRNGLFRISPNLNSVQPSPLSEIVPNHLQYLEFAGIILGKAIQENLLIDVGLTKSFMKYLLSKIIET